MKELTLPSGKIAQIADATGRVLILANTTAQDDSEVDFCIVAAMTSFQQEDGTFETLDFDRFLDEVEYEDTIALQSDIFSDVQGERLQDGVIKLPSGRLVKVVAGKTRQLLSARKKAGKDTSKAAYYMIAELSQIQNESGDWEPVIIEELLDEFPYNDVLALQRDIFAEKKTSSASPSSTSSALSGTGSRGQKSKK